MMIWTQESKDKLKALYGTMPVRQLALTFGTTESSIKHIASKYGFSNPIHYTLDKDFFAVIDTPNKAYWLGVLFADGTLWRRRGRIENVSLEVIASDASHVELLKRDVGSNAPLTYRRNAVRLHLCGQRFSGPLSIIRPKETAQPWRSVPVHLHGHFARGVFDGDGWVGKAHKYTARVTVIGSLSLCRFLARLLGSGVVSQVKHCKGGHLYDVRWSGVDDLTNVAHLFYGDDGPRLERKYQRFLDYGIIPTKEPVGGTP
jgi:hypothetical protein